MVISDFSSVSCNEMLLLEVEKSNDVTTFITILIELCVLSLFKGSEIFFGHTICMKCSRENPETFCKRCFENISKCPIKLLFQLNDLPSCMF